MLVQFIKIFMFRKLYGFKARQIRYLKYVLDLIFLSTPDKI